MRDEFAVVAAPKPEGDFPAKVSAAGLLGFRADPVLPDATSVATLSA
jgi:hypothetical protein